ncbi:MAG: tetratricopeptide repeat protein [Nitrospirales bacterium]|nr:tetratricopeptide repeat protein [Nitrospirales bacterium]
MTGEKAETSGKKYSPASLFLLFFPFLFPVLFSLSPLHASGDKLHTADELLKVKKYSEAGALYREIFLSSRKGPVAERALFGMGKADFSLRRYHTVRLNMKRLFSLYPQSAYANEAMLLLGYSALASRTYDDALRYFEKTGGEFREKALIGTAELKLKMNDIAGAEALLKELSPRALETEPRALFLKADIFSLKGMHREAIGTVDKISEAALKEEDLRVGKAQIYYYASRFEDAERLCRGIIRESSSSLEVHNAKKTLAKVHEYRGRYNEALELNLEVFSREMDDGLAMTIAKLYDRKGDAGNALRYLTFVKDKKARGREMEKRLQKLLDARDPKGAEYLSRFSPYLDLGSPFVAEASRYLIAGGREKEGTLLLKRAQQKGENGDASLALAEILINEGKNAEARKLILPVLFDKRYFFRSSFLMAEIYRREGDYPKAIRHLADAARLSKDHRILSRLAVLYEEAGDRENAVKYYAMASDTGDGVSSVRAGDLYYQGGEEEKARFYYKRALEQGVEDPQNLQWVQYQYGKLTGERGYLQKAANGGGLVGAAAMILAGEE